MPYLLPWLNLTSAPAGPLPVVSGWHVFTLLTGALAPLQPNMYQQSKTTYSHHMDHDNRFMSVTSTRKKFLRFKLLCLLFPSQILGFRIYTSQPYTRCLQQPRETHYCCLLTIKPNKTFIYFSSGLIILYPITYFCPHTCRPEQDIHIFQRCCKVPTPYYLLTVFTNTIHPLQNSLLLPTNNRTKANT